MDKRKSDDREGYNTEVLNAFRHLLKGIVIEDVDFAEKLEGQERIDFLRHCYEMVHSPYFAQVFSNLYYPQIMFSVQQADNYSEVTFGRATCNGIALVKEFYEKWAQVYDDQFINKDSEQFDKSKSFEPVE